MKFTCYTFFLKCRSKVICPPPVELVLNVLVVAASASLPAQVQTATYLIKYDFRYVTDTGAMTYSPPDSYLLYHIGDTSYFLSSNHIYNDSIQNAFQNKNPLDHNRLQDKRYMDSYMKKMSDSFLKRMRTGGTRLRVMKNLQTDSSIILLESISLPSYLLQSSQLTWQILDRRDTLAGLVCTMASTDYGGRHYQAWFAPEIPLSEGPYIFKGLPGLIVKIQDDEAWYQFTLQSCRLEPVTRYFKTKLIDEGRWQKPISREEFVRKSTELKNNPQLFGVINATPQMKLNLRKRRQKRFDLLIEQVP